MALISLVYLSLAQHKQLDMDELRSILESARRNNEQKNITGMLLFRNGMFIQALEGEEADVDEIYEVIKQDPRHRNLLVLYRNKIVKRAFDDWSMGFKVIEDDDLREIDGFSDFLEQPLTMDFFSKNPTGAMTLLDNFRGK